MVQYTSSGKYPLIDSDPHFGRVVRYMRPSDYAWWGGSTAFAPAAMAVMEYADKSGGKFLRNEMRSAFKHAGVIGFIGGFFLAYQKSSFRFWGWTENSREAQLDMDEMVSKIHTGKPLYGSSPQPEWVQLSAAKNSVYSALKLNALPMFNLVNHPYHGVDTSKYYKAAGVEPPETTSPPSLQDEVDIPKKAPE